MFRSGPGSQSFDLALLLNDLSFERKTHFGVFRTIQCFAPPTATQKCMREELRQLSSNSTRPRQTDITYVIAPDGYAFQAKITTVSVIPSLVVMN